MKIKKKNWISIVLKIFVILFVIIFLLTIAIFKDEIKTLSTTKKLNSYPFYSMNYKNNYNLNGALANKGISNDQQLMNFASKQLLKGLPVKIALPKVGCTTFAVKSPNGNDIFGRNFDLEYSPSMMVKTSPKNGYKSISMIDLRFLGLKKNSMNNPQKRLLTLAAPYIPFDGINEKGVSAAVLWVPDKVTNQKLANKPNITTSLAIRLILDKASNTNQAIKLLKKYNMHSSANGCYHFQISDAKGNSDIVEYENNKMSVIPKTGNKQVLTNFYKTKGSKYKKGAGFDRYGVIEKDISDKHDKMTEKQAMKALEDAHNGGKKHFKEKSDTQWSVVYNNSKKTANVAIGGNYNKIYHFKVN